MFTVVAAPVGAVAAFLATRSQTFTTVAVDGHAMCLLVRSFIRRTDLGCSQRFVSLQT